jgi:hypothetical protein
MGGDYIPDAFVSAPTAIWDRLCKIIAPDDWYRFVGVARKRSRRACGYTQRWQAETVVSMIKRNLGEELRGKTARSRKRDMLLKVLTHDLMIIRRRREGRDRAGHTPF